MAENPKVDPVNLDVTELEESELEGAAGGAFSPAESTNNGCPTTNFGC